MFLEKVSTQGCVPNNQPVGSEAVPTVRLWLVLAMTSWSLSLDFSISFRASFNDRLSAVVLFIWIDIKQIHREPLSHKYPEINIHRLQIVKI